MTLKAIEDRIGSLSKPSKMPCHGYSIPATACERGSLLRQIKGSVCEDCYALKNRYVFPNVQQGLNKRLNAVLNDPLWEELITELISRKERSGYFRWHDSGDILSVEHLDTLNRIALSLPAIRFWLPTRETGFISEWLGNGSKPADNLQIRLSANMVGQQPINPRYIRDTKIKTSTVGFVGALFNCPASKQGNSCQSCRACWSASVNSVNYTQH